MSDSNNIWKWIAIGLVVAVTALVCGYLVVKEFQDTQETYNKALAANALSTNQQIVELRTQDQALEDGINDLDAQQSEDIARLEQAIRDQQNVIDTQQGQIDSNQRQINDLWDRNYGLEARISALEVTCGSGECGDGDACAGNCTTGEGGCGNTCGSGSCGSCGGYYDRYGYWVSNCGSCYPYYGYP